MLSALKKKKKDSFFFFRDSTLSRLISKKKKKRKGKNLLAQAYIANGHGIDPQVPRPRYIKGMTAAHQSHGQYSQKAAHVIYTWGEREKIGKEKYK